MVQSLTISEAQSKLEALVKRVHKKKDYVIIKHDGIPIAGIMDIDEFEDYLELQDPKVERQIKKSFEEYRQGKSRPARELLSELKARTKRTRR